jgi:PBP1b-binding outer membrane lipoprotein LpoB
MNRKLLSVLLGLGLAAVLGACAEEKAPEPKTPPAAEKTTPPAKPSEAPKGGATMSPSPKTPTTTPSTPPAKK